MYHPVCRLSFCHKCVQCPCRSPHDVAARLIVLGIVVRDPAGMEQRTHQSLADIITGIVILTREILLADMVEDIVDSGYHLIVRQRQRILRVQDGKPWHDLFIRKDMSDLLFCLSVRDHCTGVHLRPGSNHGEDTSHRNDLTLRFFKTYIVFLPGIFLTINRDRHRFRIITYRTAAHSEQKVRIVISCDLHAFIEFLKCRIRHDA